MGAGNAVKNTVELWKWWYRSNWLMAEFRKAAFRWRKKWSSALLRYSRDVGKLLPSQISGLSKLFNISPNRSVSSLPQRNEERCLVPVSESQSVWLQTSPILFWTILSSN